MRLSVILVFLQLWANVEVSLSQNVCSTLPDVPHAFVSEETKKPAYQGGDVIYFTAEPGYTSSQTPKYVCSSEGWLAVYQGTSYNITCEVPVIHHLLSVAGLPAADERVKAGHKLQFQCSDEYTLDGSEEIECLQTGQWSAPFPTCTEKCIIRGVPQNVQYISSAQSTRLSKGEKLTFSCRRHGEVVRGKKVIECAAGGQWSDPFPTCGEPLGCERPPPLTDGDTKESLRYRYRHNERVEFICQNYYTMEGQPFKTCNNGEWKGEMKCLKPCTMNAEAMSEHNIAFYYRSDDKLYSPHNDEIQFRCVGRRRHDGIHGMRQRCVDGVIQLPTCL